MLEATLTGVTKAGSQPELMSGPTKFTCPGLLMEGLGSMSDTFPDKPMQDSEVYASGTLAVSYKAEPTAASKSESHTAHLKSASLLEKYSTTLKLCEIK